MASHHQRKNSNEVVTSSTTDFSFARSSSVFDKPKIKETLLSTEIVDSTNQSPNLAKSKFNPEWDSYNDHSDYEFDINELMFGEINNYDDYDKICMMYDGYDLDDEEKIMSPSGILEDDFEKEFGGFDQIPNSIQESIHSEFGDISRLGIVQLAGEDKLGRKVVVFSACRLPSLDLIDHNRLLSYIEKTLEQYVTSDYVIVYFHCGLTSKNKPSIRWMIKAYKAFDRNLFDESLSNSSIEEKFSTSYLGKYFSRFQWFGSGDSYKKNLKNFYVIHPTLTVKLVWNVFKPFASTKFRRKLIYVDRLIDLEDYLYLDQLPVPNRVKQFDKSLAKGRVLKDIDMDYASIMGSQILHFEEAPTDPTQQFGVSLQYLKKNNYNREIPVVVEQAIQFIQKEGLNVERLFRRTVSPSLVREVQSKYNRGDYVDLYEYDDPHLAAVLLKTFLRELTEPILTFDLFDEILSLDSKPSTTKIDLASELLIEIPDENYICLKSIIKLLTEVAERSSINKMTAQNLAVVFGPNFIWSRNQMTYPVIQPINAFSQLMITHYEKIFMR